jgi:predicted nucleic acid-binding protein
MIVVADTSPINYLLLIGHIDLLPRLYGRVVVPTSVALELSDADAPAVVKSWIESRPDWIDISEANTHNHLLDFLDRGERDGIALAQALHADVILLDDLEARREAQIRKLYVTGTLGVLRDSAENGWINFSEAVAKLRSTNFRASPSLISRLLEQNKK